ncbi:hypothetical protein PWG14_24805 [Chromobacterium amazonense]|uniref:hypothetical protein n=1 Tax=Chromobacterium amazonense TaxID=1382803 RepID=UPI00237D7FC6|nr:hypothetical protein [Chromobacterium amazonense]MDE1715689.1 hypothetical protein [Chromobacterium amazonense]
MSIPCELHRIGEEHSRINTTLHFIPDVGGDFFLNDAEMTVEQIQNVIESHGENTSQKIIIHYSPKVYVEA